MPRRPRRDRSIAGERGRRPPEDVDEIRSRLMGPSWASLEGYEVRNSVKEDRIYTCPFCNGPIAAGIVHVVAYPIGNVDDRRHYHSPCWRKHRKIAEGRSSK